MDLFDYMRKNTIEQEAPLASRLRPSTLDEVVGQKHIIGKDKLLYRAIKADKLGSLIFYGPPGTGKTTLARVIANTTSARFEQLNATVAGKKDMEQVVQDAKDALGMYGKRTILFIDEIHRFNKARALHVRLRVVERVRDLSDRDFLLLVAEQVQIYLHIFSTGSRHICINKYVRNRRCAHRQPVFESYSHLLTSLLAILCPHISCYHLSISSLRLCKPLKLLYFTFILKYSLFVPSKSSCFLTFPPF